MSFQYMLSTVKPIIAKVYDDDGQSVALVKVTTLINRIDIKTMNNNNTAGLSYYLQQTLRSLL